MGTKTKIAWCDHTFNPWRGCSPVSPGCENCYARRMAKRRPELFGTWGPDGERVVAPDWYWKLPYRWNAAAERAGVRRRVFCGSMMDVLEDRDDLDEPRARLLTMIEQTPALDWLLLTKRPAPEWHFGDLGNLWLGVSVENQEQAYLRIPMLLEIPAVMHFVSFEPLLEPIEMAPGWLDALDWVIVGGETGPGARRCSTGWIELLIEQCWHARVPVFVKQLGAAPYMTCLPWWSGVCGEWVARMSVRSEKYYLRFRDRAGADPAEWPPALRMREFP